MRKGRKSAAQTPAPQKERVYGSNKNPIGSAASEKSAGQIKLSTKILDALKNKVEEYNKRHKNDVSLSTAKAVMRRGMGAYSKSHRPTISGGAPNSRQAWGFARVNKFLKKKSGEPVKKAYIQDDDLLADGGELMGKFKRLAAGYYEATYRGNKVTITQQEENAYGGRPMWYFQINDGSVNDLYFTKSEAVKAAKQVIDSRFGKGGETGQDIKCHNCGWKWSTKDSEESDKYKCHKCGKDNSKYYLNMGAELPVGKLAKGMNLSEVAAHHGLKAEDLKSAIQDGIDTELEHTNNPEIARAIALDHLYEDPQYYTKLKKIEKPQTKERVSSAIMSVLQSPNKSAERAGLWKRLHDKRASMAEGGHVVDANGQRTNDGKKGGYFEGRSHAEGGIKAFNKDTNTPIEVEGDEVIITKGAVRDQKKRNFEGQMLTNREILSKINQSGGGVAFADGGETSDCGCDKYEDGGPAEFDVQIMSCREVEELADGLYKLSVQAPQLHSNIVDLLVYLKKLQIVQNC